MHYLFPIICSLLMAFTLADAHAQDARSLDTIRWILGDWIKHGDRTTVRETWRELRNDAFKGIGVTTDSDSEEKRSDETVFLAEMSDGIYYFAKVKQNKYPVPFELTSCSDTHAVFENTEHDFPKKLEYRLVAKDALDVKVSDGAKRSFTIHFKRNEPSNLIKE